jgi:hypothetical protein
MGLSKYFFDQLAESFSRGHIGLMSGDTEIRQEGYDRQSVTLATTAGSDGFEASNVSLVDFGAAPSHWGTVDGVGIFDARSEGNLLYRLPFDEPTIVGRRVRLSFAAGMIKFGLSND